MGYGGFGLQKWIYKQKARKPFTNSRKGAVENSEFSGNFNVPVGAYNKEKALENISKRRIKDLVLIVIILVALIGVGFYFYNSFSNYETVNQKNRKDSKLAFETESFNILMQTGMSYYETGTFVNAAKEFELAYKIKQTKELKKKLLSCYYELCKTQKEYCNKYESMKSN